MLKPSWMIFGYEVLRHKIEIAKGAKVSSCFTFHWAMAQKIKSMTLSLEKICKESIETGVHGVELINSSPNIKQD